MDMNLSGSPAGTLATGLGLNILQVQQWSKVCSTRGGPVFLPLLLSTLPTPGSGHCQMGEESGQIYCARASP